MAAQQQYKLKVKVSNNEDTRLWRYTSMDDFDGLCTFITTTWNHDDFLAQYEDDEGDLITIANAVDLQEAFECALQDNKKSLKIKVSTRAKAPPQAEQKENDAAQPAAASCPFAKQFGSTREMVVDFLSNEQIIALLPEFFGAVISSLIEKGSDLKVDEIASLIRSELQQQRYRVITTHPLYLRYGVLATPYIANRIAGQQSLYPHFRLDTIKQWILQLIQMLHQVLRQTEATHGCAFKDIVIDIEYPVMTDTGKVIHFGVECDLCGQYPIIGDRYKCSICQDWDCCSSCEPKHDHPLIKFKKSSKNHKNAAFKGLTEIMQRLSGAQEAQRVPVVNDANDEAKEDDIDNIDIYDEVVCDCICGAKMQCVVAKKAYKRGHIVYCDGCSAQSFNEMVYHCPNEYDPIHHKDGYDLCTKCAQKKAEADNLNEEELPEEPKEEAPKQPEPEPEPEPEQKPEDKVPEQPAQEQQVEEEEEEEEEQFEYAAQLTQIKQIMAIHGNDNDESIKELLVKHKGDLSRVVPLLLE